MKQKLTKEMKELLTQCVCLECDNEWNKPAPKSEVWLVCPKCKKRRGRHKIYLDKHMEG